MAEMEETRVALGKSILVPSVKELAKAPLSNVPDRYVRHDFDNNNNIVNGGYDNNEEYVDNCSNHVRIPIIDMKCLISGDDMELQRLNLASKDWGFFQLINHGVSSSLIEKFKVGTKEFFNLPMEEKKKYWQTPSDVEGFGQAFVVSEEQKLDWGDLFYLTTYPKHLRRSHLLPMLPHPYRETLESYAMELQNLAKNIIDCMGKALNIDVEEMRSMLGEGSESIRMNWYPPCPQPEKVIGLTPHSDASAVTILLHLNQVEGLQIVKDNKWISVKPLPDAFTVNIGDVIEILSNGKYRSILHRAVVNAHKERLSVATFYTAAIDREIGPLPSLITTQNPAKFRRISMVDYWKGFFGKTLDGKSYLESLRIYEKL